MMTSSIKREPLAYFDNGATSFPKPPQVAGVHLSLLDGSGW